jgi:two-component system LytT family sensor kinase
MELAAWVIVAALTGIALSLVGAPSREYESGLLVFMLAGFWLALPGRAPVTWIAIACGIGPVLANYFSAPLARHNPPLPSLLAVFTGAFAGLLAGKRLELSPYSPSANADDVAWFVRPFDVRTLLALALSALVALSLVPVWRTVTTATWAPGLAEVRRWQVLTFLAWVLAAKSVIRIRTFVEKWLASFGGTTDGLTPLAALAHLVVVVLFSTVHAFVIVALVRVSPMVRPMVAESAFSAVPGIFFAYLPFDLLAYATIVGLAYLADSERQARESRQRAAVLQADALTSRLSAVRARLNPHFLYNALNAAVMLARSGRGAETSRVLEDITGLLRYVLNEDVEHVPLAREIEFVRRYIEIQQVRFGSQLRFSIDTSPETEGRDVPPLVLQPLVENAVEHGIAAGSDACEIRVTAFLDGDVLVMRVDDDGDGTNDDTNGDAAGAGIGLGHTRERLIAMYGDRASVSLTPLVPHGMRAEVRVPGASA